MAKNYSKKNIIKKYIEKIKANLKRENTKEGSELGFKKYF